MYLAQVVSIKSKDPRCAVDPKGISGPNERAIMGSISIDIALQLFVAPIVQHRIFFKRKLVQLNGPY
jgi:hypothetical protein